MIQTHFCNSGIFVSIDVLCLEPWFSSVVPGPVASVSPVKLLDGEFLGSTPDFLDQKPTICVLVNPPLSFWHIALDVHWDFFRSLKSNKPGPSEIK
jgi:hypothetical protein